MGNGWGDCEPFWEWRLDWDKVDGLFPGGNNEDCWKSRFECELGFELVWEWDKKWESCWCKPCDEKWFGEGGWTNGDPGKVDDDDGGSLIILLVDKVEMGDTAWAIFAFAKAAAAVVVVEGTALGIYRLNWADGFNASFCGRTEGEAVAIIEAGGGVEDEEEDEVAQEVEEDEEEEEEEEEVVEVVDIRLWLWTLRLVVGFNGPNIEERGGYDGPFITLHTSKPEIGTQGRRKKMKERRRKKK
jgi:hypothetical protein